jgi:hypothetical protein
MARRRPIYIQKAAQRFRDQIRPSLFGAIGKTEPGMSRIMADELFDWLQGVVTAAVADTSLNDRKHELSQQLHAGTTVIGRTSLRTLTGRIDAYPWVFPHEFGGELHPHSGPYLTIPIFFALRPDGSPKYRSARAWQRWGSFVYTKKETDQKFIAYKAASGELRILYVLVDKVTIPKRLRLNQIANATLGRLIAVWSQIYIQEASRVSIVPPFMYRE